MGYNFTRNRWQRAFLALALVTSSCSVKAAAMDYNRDLINKGGSITITPQTSSAVLASYTQAINTNGLLDQTFGGAGNNVTAIGTFAIVNAIAIQPDGKIVAVGFATLPGGDAFTIIRYNVNGSLDTSFGGGLGYVTTPFGTGDEATGVVLQSDGKIVAGGTVLLAGLRQFAAMRYNTNGTLDTTFNAAGTTPGVITTVLVAQASSANGIALQTDGKILLAGKTEIAGAWSRFGLVRYTANGTLDTTFGAGGTGIVTLSSISAGNDSGQAVALQSDGKIVVAGYSNNGAIDRFATVRYTINGILDTATFGNGLGYVVTELNAGAVVLFSSSAWALVIQSDQKIVVGGSTSSVDTTCALARYTTAGVLDPSFGAGVGYVTTPITVGALGTNGQINSLALQTDGKIVAAGQITIAGLQQFALLRYNLDGSLDTSFGGPATGYVTTIIAPGVNSFAKAVAVQADGKLVVSGISDIAFATARYINPFTLATFTASYGAVGLL